MRWSCRNGCVRGVELGAASRSPPSAVIAVDCGPRHRAAAARRSSPPVGWRSSSSTPSAPATSDLAAAARRRRARGGRRATPASGGSMSMPATSIIFGIEPRLAMPISRPGGPVDRDAADAARARSREIALAEQVVGGRVVGLAGVAEAPGDRAEDHGRARLRVAERVQEVEPAVGLDVEDEVELGLRLVGQEVADLEPAGVDQHVDAAARGERGGDRRLDLVGVGQVRLVPVRGAAGAPRSPRSRRAPRARARSAPARARRASASAARRPARMRSARSRLRPSRSAAKRARSGSAAVGRGHEVEQVERAAAEAAARSAVIAETMLPAAPVMTKTSSGSSVRARGRCRGRLPRAEPDGPAQARRRGRSRPRRGRAASRRSSASASAAVLRVAAKSTALISASGRSRASALVKPVTAPPMTDVAPAAS